MTKRFTINMEDECIDDAKNEIFIDFNDKIDFYQLCELLNKLHEENQLLKLQSETKLYSRRELEKENERLRKCINEIYTIARLEEVD